MISILRHFLVDSWFGRVLAFVVFLSFIFLGGTFLSLGNGGLGTLMGGGGVVSVGSKVISPIELARAIRLQINFSLQNGLDPAELKNPQIQDQISREALRNLILADEVSQAAQRQGFIISDDAIRQKVLRMPEFMNKNGQFDAAKMDDLLKRNNLTHGYLISHTKQELQNEVAYLGLANMAEPSQDILNFLVNFYGRVRVADIYRLPFSEGKVTEAPTEAQLKRFYLNHLSLFREPEFRHARIVAMTAETVAKTLHAPEDVLKRVYETELKTNARDFDLPETRSVYVLTFSDEKKAREVLNSFAKGVGLEEIVRQKSAVISTQINDARKTDFPDPALGQAAFEENMKKSKENIVGPVKTAAGWSLIDILSIKPPHKVSFEEARPNILKQIQQSQAEVALRGKLLSFKDAVAGSTDLNKISTDLGAVAIAGTINNKGVGKNGDIMPLPGSESLHRAIIAQVFAQDTKTLPHVITEPDGSAFAVITDEIEVGRAMRFEEAHTQILLAWQFDAKKHEANQRATALYLDAQKNNLRSAIAQKGEESSLKKDVEIPVLSPPQDYSPLLRQALLRGKVGHAQMIEDGDSFWILFINSEHPLPQEEQELLKKRLAEREKISLSNDVAQSLANGYMLEKMPRHFSAELFEQAKNAAFGQ